MSKSDLEKWHAAQVAVFNDKRGNHSEVAVLLERILNEIKRHTDPMALVQVRPKSLASFSEKVIRKKNKYREPIKQLTDLIGGRIITYTQPAADAVCRLIESLDAGSRIENNRFLIDWDNSVDTGDRLKPEEFGYKARHYIVQLIGPDILGVHVDDRIRPYKMEIQVCTMLQHVWAAIGHDRLYKTQLTVGDSLKRRLSAVSALLGIAQREFDEGIVALDRYIGGFHPYTDPAAQKEEITIWESVLEVESHDYQARRKLAEIHASIGQWQQTFDYLLGSDEKNKEAPGHRALLGRAAEHIGNDPEAERLYREAADKDHGDWSVRYDLAEFYTRKGMHAEALERYRQAFDFAPHEPRVLAGFVMAIASQEKQLACTTALRGALNTAIEECKRRADLHVDLPDAFLQSGRCHLFCTDVYSALDAYCKAALTCQSTDQIERERKLLDRLLASLKDHDDRILLPFKSALKLLDLLSVPIAVRLNQTCDHRILEKLATKKDRPSFSLRPVMIVAGGCDTHVEDRMKTYQTALQGALANFEGTIICGGTTAGISGLIGAIAGRCGERTRCFGYLPVEVPPGDTPDDTNYENLAIHDGPPTQYTPLGPIQMWADLLLAGVDPSEVRLLGINGGDLSGFEFRLAMAMGATVGLVEDSGRAVSTLLTDPDWKRLGRLAPLFNEAATIAPFVCAFCPTLRSIPAGPARVEKLETLARAKHDNYRKSHLSSSGYVHQSMLPWDKRLGEGYKRSNRQQANYIDHILASEGFTIVAADDPRPGIDFHDPQYEDALERMAIQEHGRFNAERLADGWRFGSTRDLDAKTSPYLVPWDKLPADIKKWDRDPFLELSELLPPLCLKVVRITLDPN